MFRLLLTLTLSLLFTNCSSVYAGRSESLKSKQERKVPLQAENILLLVAMDYSVRGESFASAEIFKQLYLEGAGSGYLTEYLKSLNESGQFLKVIEEGSKFTLVGDDDRREIGKSFFAIGDYDRALEEYSKIEVPTENDLRVLAEIYFKKGDYQTSVQYIEKAYKINPAIELVLSLAKVTYLYLGDRDRAISLLNSHNRLYEFDREVAKYLARVYKDNGQYNEALKIYRELYSKTSEEEFAISIVELLSYLSKTDELISFLKETKYNNELLLRLYMSNKLYRDGYDLSEEIFKKSKDPYILAQNAVFEYELKRLNKIAVVKFLPSVISKLEESVYKINDASYFNYLGYLMIDHDYRVKDGIKYVKVALSLEPDSYYIIDSLAWGEYKLGNCKEAYRNMKIVIDNLGLEDKEIEKHWKKIEACQ